MATRKVEDVLREAAVAVEAAKLPDDLRSAAFAKAVDLIAGGGAPAVSEVTPTAKAETKKAAGDQDPLSMIAKRFSVTRELADEAFAIEDGEPSLAVARTKLANSDKGASRQIAVLVAAARQAAGMEEWTESSVIRDAAASYNRFDPNNFANTVGSLEDDFSFSGKGQSRRVKVRRDGFKKAGALVQQLVGLKDD